MLRNNQKPLLVNDKTYHKLNRRLRYIAINPIYYVIKSHNV